MKQKSPDKPADSVKPKAKKSTKPVDKENALKNLNIPPFPGARLLPGEMVGNSVEMILMQTDATLAEVLQFYQTELTNQGLKLFESQELADRTSLSFRTDAQKVVTVLAAKEDKHTRITIYIQK